MNIYYIFIFIFGLYILKFTNSNLIKFDPIDQLFILSMFNNINNTSKKKSIKEVTRNVKIKQFQEFIYNLIIYLSILIQTKNINPR